MTAGGWCWPASVRPGDTVLHVERPAPRLVEVVRDGHDPTTMWSADDVAAIPTGEDCRPATS